MYSTLGSTLSNCFLLHVIPILFTWSLLYLLTYLNKGIKTKNQSFKKSIYCSNRMLFHKYVVYTRQPHHQYTESVWLIFSPSITQGKRVAGKHTKAQGYTVVSS